VNIEVTKTKKSRIKKVDFNNLEFGVDFSDHMFTVHYKDGKWETPEILPYGTIKVEPSLCSLHYGQVVFEGLKAFRTVEGRINLFRPDKYHERFNRSNKRLCIPFIPYELFINGIRELVFLDQAWIPDKKGCSLYIRPFVFAADNFLGVRVSYTYNFMIITSPVGAYYKEGINPVKLITPGGYVRAVKGGLGDVKTPANYAASLYPGEEAKKKGFTQVLWLITPPLEGSILPGVTRDSVISLANHWGIPVEERMITIEEVFSTAKNNTLQEVFGTGTAAVISPVGWIQHKDEMITINRGEIGPLSQKFYDEITGMHYGEKPNLFGWCLTL
jgi:branched-chain amino acid aminotransferase